MHETAHQQPLTLVGRPQQFQTRHGRTFADRVPDRHQPFGSGEVIGLVREGEAMVIKALLDRLQRQATPFESQGFKQLRQGDAVLHRHRSAAMQHHRQSEQPRQPELFAVEILLLLSERALTQLRHKVVQPDLTNRHQSGVIAVGAQRCF